MFLIVTVLGVIGKDAKVKFMDIMCNTIDPRRKPASGASARGHGACFIPLTILLIRR